MRKAGKVTAVLLLMAASPAAGEPLTLYGLAADDSFVEFGRPGGIGDMIVWNAELQDEQGNQVGTDTGTCIQVDADGNHVCTMVLDHHGHGILTLSGVQAAEPGTSTLAIVGGSGDYAGATGAVTSRPVEDRARFRYEIDVRTP